MLTEDGNRLVSIEPQNLRIDTMKFEYGWDLWQGEGTGLLSAFLEDFDGDGELEMLTVTLKYTPTISSSLGEAIFDTQEFNDKTSQYHCMVLVGRQYDLNKTGEVIETAGKEMALMPTNSWGTLLVGIENLDDQYVLFGRATTENMSTYGTPQLAVSDLGTNSMNWRYFSDHKVGRADEDTYMKLLHIYNPLDISTTTLAKLNFSGNVEENLGARLISLVDFNYVEWGGKDMIVTAKDYTNLRKNLRDNGNSWKRIELPIGGTENNLSERIRNTD